MRKICISYRRAGAEYAAGALGRELRRYFGDEQVFRDKEDIDGGVSWKQQVLAEIDHDSALLVLIDKDWTSAKDEEGKRRLEDADDPILLEINDGIRNGAEMIPILLENAQMPGESELPPALKPIAEVNALNLRDSDWQYDLDHICKTLEKCGFKPVSRESPAARARPSSDTAPSTVPARKVRGIPIKLIASYVIGVVALIGLAETHDRETYWGLAFLSLLALALAGLAYRDFRHGRLDSRWAPIGAIMLGALCALGYLGWQISPKLQSDLSAETSSTAMPAAATTTASEPDATVRAEPGTMIISAIGLADPSGQKYRADKSLLAADLRADSESQLVEKAIALYLDHASLAKNYDLLRDRLLSKSSRYIARIVKEDEAHLGKDGLMYLTTQGAVKVREVQRSLNEMSRDERIDFIRNNGDPKILVSITVRGDNAEAPAQRSQVAENLLKERIKSFGFRIWADDPKIPATKMEGPDFAVSGEVKLKKLSARLAASGITVEKYALTSWTVKCIDRESGEEIYYNNKLPVASGSWASEEQALAAVGGKIAGEFSRDFFVQHFNASGQKLTLTINGLPDRAAENAIARELIGLQSVIDATRRAGSAPAVYDMQLSGSIGPLTNLVAGAILKPLNAKLGQACFNLGAALGEQIVVTFDKACSDKAVLARLDTNPPASLYAAPLARQRSVLTDPDAIRKLTI